MQEKKISKKKKIERLEFKSYLQEFLRSTLEYTISNEAH